MSIEFAALTNANLTGSLNVTLPRLRPQLLANYVTGVEVELPPLGAHFVGQINEETPTYVGFDILLPPPQVDMQGYYKATGTLDLSIPAPYTTLYSGTRLAAELPALAFYGTTASPAFVAANVPVEIQFVAAFEAPRVSEDIVLLTEVTATWAVILEAVFTASDKLTLIAKLRATITDSFTAQDTFTIVLQGVLADQITLDFEDTAVLRMIYLLADQLTLADETVGFYSALVTVASAVVLGDTVIPGLDGTLSDDFAISEEMSAKIRAVVEMVSDLLMEDALEPGLHLFAALEDSFAVSLDQLATIAMLAEILDTASLGVRITTPDGDVFIGYSVNTRNAAASEYQNYNFTSMAVIDGIPYGTGPDGIYRLTGDDDEGTPIHASVYTGLMDFGSSFLKQLPAAWIGLTSTGEMVLKVVTTDSGKKKENWYRMKERPKGTPVDSRFSPAKGLEGRYWGFKIENLNGADFQIDSLKLWPLVMKRRYSGR